MFRYADPAACPVCRSSIQAGATGCDRCGTQLSGTVALSLFRTLTQADGLVAQLSALSANSTEARTASTSPALATGMPIPAVAGLAPAPHATGLTSASVPKILLGLGALCLLVASIVFLAVAWALLGVGGRTVVLILLTAGAGVLGWQLAKRGLRAGAEAFLCVAMGLLTLDVFGANSSGWFGGLGDAGFLVVLGSALAAAGLGSAAFLRPCPTGTLISTQLVGGFGVGLATSGITQLVFSSADRDVDLVALAAVVWIILLAGGILGTQLLRMPIASLVLTVGVGIAWLELTVLGFARIDLPPTYAGTWNDFGVWPTVLAALLACALSLPVWPFRVLPVEARVGGTAVGVALLTALVVLPVVDESANVVVLVESVVVGLAVVATFLMPRPWRLVVAVPICLAACGLFVSGTMLAGGVLDTLLGADTWTLDVGTSLERAGLFGHWPALIPFVTLALLLAAWVVANLVRELPVQQVTAPLAVIVATSAVFVPTAYGVPLGAMVGLLLTATAALVGASVLTSDSTRLTAGILAVGLGALAVVVSLQSEVLTAVTTGLLTVLAVLASLIRHPVARLVGDVVFAPAAAVFLWTTLDLAGLDETWRSVPMLVVLGGWAILGARPEREMPVALLAGVTIVLCTGNANGFDQTWLAVDLTLAGVLAHLSALANVHRRWLGWVGLGLMVLAQWVRLAELGVETVEAYTLPLALVLAVVGVIRMRDQAMRSFRALGPALGLGLVPTFLVAMAEPVSLRALLLGLACSALVLAGTGARWSAPIVAGAVIGAPLVLREVTHAIVLPQWVVIGLIGIVLTVVGITWERSLNEVRQATSLLRRLR